jgi:DDE_Tnp_1-associated
VTAPVVPPLLPYLQAIPDPRQPSGRRHPLPAVLALACAAMLAGCDSLLAIAEWGRDPHGGAPLARQLGFTRDRTPCVATLHRVFKRLDASAFERAVGAWATAASAGLARAQPPAVAIDGKTLRGSRQPAVPAVQLLGAVGHDLGLVLAQARVDPATDEVGALPEVLAALVLEGRVLTLDAAFTERAVAEAILAKGGPI